MVQEAYQVKYFYSESSEQNELLYLSVFISNQSFQYAIFTKQFNTIIEIANIEFKDAHLAQNNPIEIISLLINTHFLNQKKFEKVNISILNNQFTLLPDSFVDDANIKTLLNFSSGVDEVNKNFQHKIKYCNFCYAIPNEWMDYLGKTFPQASIRHAGAISVSFLFEQFSLINSQLFIYIHQSQIEIVAKQQKQLLFYNVFSFETKENILYYLLFTMEQLDLNPLLCKLTLAGEMETNDDLIMSIKKYVKQVDFCVLDKSISFKNQSNNSPLHYYFTLLNQHLCAL